MKQHYIPKCYLNEFIGYEGKLATIDYSLIKQGRKPDVSFKSPTQIGYEIDFYTLDVDLPEPYQRIRKLKPYLIEQDIFWRYENAYPGILDQVRNRRPLIRKQAELFIYALISMKLRNKYILNPEMQKGLLKNVISNDKEDILQKSMELFPHLTREEKLDTIKAVEEKIIKNDDFVKGANLMALIQRETNRDGVIFEIATKLFNYEWKIVETNFTAMFITSDNPGYCLDSSSIPFNTKFADCTFIFPLTPAFCLIISDKKRDVDIKNDSLFKSINYEMADTNTIKRINTHSTFFCNRYLVAQTKQTLESLNY